MIKLTATARIHGISQVIQVSENFQKRELVLDDSWSKDGKTYPNFVCIEFTGDKMFILDNFAPGQLVTVEAFVNGREHQGRYFNTLRGQSVALYRQPQQPAMQQPMAYPQQPAAYQQPTVPTQPAYAPPAVYPQQQAYAPPTAYTASPQYPQQCANLGPEGLPFR